jgi:hypothetical protein
VPSYAWGTHLKIKNDSPDRIFAAEGIVCTREILTEIKRFRDYPSRRVPLKASNVILPVTNLSMSEGLVA